MNLENLKSKITILVLFSKSYESLIEGFVTFFLDNWADCPFEVYLSIESGNYSNDKFIIINNTVGSWSRRLYSSLKAIKSEFVYIILDDYFIFEKVDAISFYRLISAGIEENYDHLSVYITDDQSKISKLKPKNRRFNYSYFIGSAEFHKVSSLLQLLRTNENAWEFEHYASLRASIKPGYKSGNYFLSKHPLRYIDGGVIKKGRLREEAIEYFNKINYTLIWNNVQVPVLSGNESIKYRLSKKVKRLIKTLVNIFFNKI
jgi:hypothetical protein